MKTKYVLSTKDKQIVFKDEKSLNHYIANFKPVGYIIKTMYN